MTKKSGEYERRSAWGRVKVRSALVAAMATLLLASGPALAGSGSRLSGLDALYPSLDALYRDLHSNPELSLHEEKTAAKLASRMRDYGYTVTERVGGHGVVALLANGEGPTVYVRTDMDALPIREQTGLPYSSAMTAAGADGESVPVMHACGHDVHMVSWVGAAAWLAGNRDRWRGTVVFVGQPAEELLVGARRMIADGLLERFPKPDYVVGMHVTHTLPAGKVGIVSGPASAASNAVDITFFGKGGHGGAPHRTVDPLLIAARTVVTLQTIVSREIDPLDPAVVTVGTFHAGTKRNIIPEDATIQLTVRSFKADVQKRILASIERIAKAESAAAGVLTEPRITVHPDEASDVLVNDPALAARLTAALRRDLGEANVGPVEPVTTSEDFGVYGTTAGAPGVQIRLGASEPGAFVAAMASGKVMPGPHSPLFAPDRERTLRTGVEAFTAAVLELMGASTARK